MRRCRDQLRKPRMAVLWNLRKLGDSIIDTSVAPPRSPSEKKHVGQCKILGTVGTKAAHNVLWRKGIVGYRDNQDLD
jgi:hypothetical protein